MNRIKIIFILFFILLLCSINFPAAAASIAAELIAISSTTNSADTVDVIITLKNKAQLSSILNDKNSISKKTRLIRALQENALQSQKSVRAVLSNNALNPSKILWLTNSIAVSLPSYMLPILSRMGEIESIRLDKKIQAPVQKPTAPVTLNTVIPELLASPGWNISQIRAQELWTLGHAGQGVTVAIVDTGVDINHPDLSEAYRGGNNSWYDPNGEHATPHDAIGHGTQVTGLIVGTDNSGTTIGVAPSAKWLGVKIFNDAGVASLSSIHAALQWLLDPDGNPDSNDSPDIINNSWNLGDSQDTCDLEFQTDIQLLIDAGIALVFSSGNSGPSASTSFSPANNDQTIAVASVNEAFNISSFSSRGPSPCSGVPYPQIAAPGELVVSTYLTNGGIVPKSYITVSGTSFAAPHVSGAMALLKSYDPNLTMAQIESALYENVLDQGASGFDNTYGIGILDVANAYYALSGAGLSPNANPDTIVTNEDTPTNFDILVNDIADNSTSIDLSSVSIVLQPQNGLLNVQQNGIVVYTPYQDYFGNDMFRYTVKDAIGRTSNAANVLLDIQPQNDAPIILSQRIIATTEESTTTLSLNDLVVVDPDNSYPSDFTLIPEDGTNYSRNGKRVTPHTDFNGNLSVPVRVSDGLLYSNTFQVAINVTAINDPPIITSQSDLLAFAEDSNRIMSLADLIVFDPDNTFPTDFGIQVYDGMNFTRSGNSITPIKDFNGTLSIPVSVDDGTQNSNTFAVTVNILPVNDPPVIIGQAGLIPLEVMEDSIIQISLDNVSVSDPDNTYPEDFTLSVQSGPYYSVQNNAVSPDANYFGTLQVPILVSDGDKASQTFPLTIEVVAVNDAPIIRGQVPMATQEDTPLEFELSQFSVEDPDSLNLQNCFLNVQDGVNYSHVGNIITPALRYNGVLTIPVTVSDTLDTSDVFYARLYVVAVNNQPTILQQSSDLITLEDKPIDVNLTDLFVVDADNNYPFDFTLIIHEGENYSRNGVRIFPQENYFGTLTVPVSVSDGSSTSQPFNITIQVSPVNDAPIITDQSIPIELTAESERTLEIADIAIYDPDNIADDFSLTVLEGEHYVRHGNSIQVDSDFHGALLIPIFVNDGTANSPVFKLTAHVNDRRANKKTGFGAAGPAELILFFMLLGIAFMRKIEIKTQ